MDTDSLLASVPTPTADDMAALRKTAHHYTLVFLRKGPTSRDDEARNAQLQLEHLQHLTKLQMLGKLALNGPTLVEHEILGVSVYATDLEEARALAEADPKVKAGYLTVEAIPWMAVPAPSENS
ncbi:MAG: YciI family protein [Anaerolineae bacterium]